MPPVPLIIRKRLQAKAAPQSPAPSTARGAAHHSPSTATPVPGNHSGDTCPAADPLRGPGGAGPGQGRGPAASRVSTALPGAAGGRRQRPARSRWVRQWRPGRPVGARHRLLLRRRRRLLTNLRSASGSRSRRGWRSQTPPAGCPHGPGRGRGRARAPPPAGRAPEPGRRRSSRPGPAWQRRGGRGGSGRLARGWPAAERSPKCDSRRETRRYPSKRKWS